MAKGKSVFRAPFLKSLALRPERFRSGTAQFIIATHSPIIMSYPATLLFFDGGRIREVAYTATNHYRITRDFLQDPESHLRQLFTSADEDEAALNDGDDG